MTPNRNERAIKLVSGLDDDEGWAADQVMGLRGR